MVQEKNKNNHINRGEEFGKVEREREKGETGERSGRRRRKSTDQNKK